MQSEQGQKEERQDYDWAQHTDLPVGEILRRTREYYNLSLADVENSLRIRAVQLSAMEEGRIDQLPGRVYAIGFVRSYAEFLGLDGNKMIQIFKAQGAGNARKPSLHFPVPASESKSPNTPILMMSATALALIITVLAVFGGEKPVRSDLPLPPVVQESVMARATSGSMYGPFLDDIQPAAGTEVVQMPATETTQVTATVANETVIRVVDNSWVEIRNASGKVLLSRLLKTGDRFAVPNEKGLILHTGNIAGLDFVIDGESMPVLGKKGDVLRNLNLDRPELLALFKKLDGNLVTTSN